MTSLNQTTLQSLIEKILKTKGQTAYRQAVDAASAYLGIWINPALSVDDQAVLWQLRYDNAVKQKLSKDLIDRLGDIAHTLTMVGHHEPALKA